MRPASAVGTYRAFAKKAKGKKGKKQANKASKMAQRDDDDDDDDGAEDEGDVGEASVEKMEGEIESMLEHLKGELSTLRGGRADPSMFDHVKVDAYGSSQPLSGLAQATMKSAKLAVITPYDPMLADAIRAALVASGLNLNPTLDGHVLTVPVPKPSKETRDSLVKLARQHAETIKQRLRRSRQDAISKLKAANKKKSLSDDDVRMRTSEVDGLSDKTGKLITSQLADKEAQILAV